MAGGMHLSLESARALMLAAQGLLEHPQHPATKDDVLAAIQQMGALQIDTINVVARSPYFVLWSRLGTYDPRWLDDLLAEGKLFEYWSHAACFLPIEDYSLYRRRMIDGQQRAETWLGAHHAVVDRVLQRVRERGPVRSAEFERTDGRVGTWWDWKPEKIALEYLFNIGTLMVARREHFQRLYDLRERVLPGWDDTQVPSGEEMRRALALTAVRALGVTPARWVPDYFRTSKRGIATLLDTLAAEGAVMRVTVEGWDAVGYVHRDHATLAAQAAGGALRPTLTTLLSPFDPLVSDRARAEAMWNFHYRIETYTPAPRRRYGYFSLPILHRDALIGRLDAKAHRKAAVFEVRALHLEEGVTMTAEDIADLAGALYRCALWHGTPEVRVREATPPRLAPLLEAGVVEWRHADGDD